MDHSNDFAKFNLIHDSVTITYSLNIQVFCKLEDEKKLIPDIRFCA